MKIVLLFILMFGLLVLSGCQGDWDLDADDIIVCESPYMRFATGCCLDQNNNGICDSDEVVEEEEVEDDELFDDCISYGLDIFECFEFHDFDANDIISTYYNLPSEFIVSCEEEQLSVTGCILIYYGLEMPPRPR